MTLEPDGKALLDFDWSEEWERHQVSLMSYDGQYFRQLGPSLDGSIIVGLIRKSKTIPWKADPAELLSLFYWGPGEILDYHQCSPSVGERRRIGRFDCVSLILETRARAKGEAFRFVYWLAPELGHAPVEYDRLRKPSTTMGWRIVDHFVSQGFVEVEGVWLPSAIHVTEHGYNDDGGYDLEQDFVATFEKWKINQRLKPETFRISFPAGAWVTDEIRGVTYTKGKIGDPEIARQVSEAGALVIPSAEVADLVERLTAIPVSTSDSGFWVGLGVSVTSVIGLGAAVYGLIRAKRRSRTGMENST